MKSLLPEKVHHSIYIFALLILVVGLPTSKFLMSLGQLILIGNWLLEGNLKNKLVLFWKNKTAVWVSSLLLLHFIGLLYSSDLDYALKDIRIKFPLLVLPLILSTSKPIAENIFNNILNVFVASVVFGTIVSTLILTGVYYNAHVETRGISIFISHIRFSLLICVAVFISGYFFINSKEIILKIAWLLVMLWLSYFLTLLGSLTGLLVLPLAFIVFLIAELLKSGRVGVKWIGFVVLLITVIVSITFMRSFFNDDTKNEVVDYSKLEKYTSRGNLYEHDTSARVYENGNLIWIYYCNQELEESWNKRSKIKVGSKDKRGNDLYHTLIRYLSSRGMRKDAEAVYSLSNNEIVEIENGIANVNYKDYSALETRVHETIWEIDLYRNTGDADGHSLTQRYEYWKTAVNIIKSNLLFGVGTGDVPMAFEEEYAKTNSGLAMERRLRSHNQYLSIGVAFGLFGLLWFLMVLFYPIISGGGQSNHLYFTFFIVAFISFFTEDTLETQAGVTFFAFFNSFLLFAKGKHANEL